MVTTFAVMKNLLIIFLVIFGSHITAFSQDMTALVNKVKTKLDLVSDYTADGILKTDIVFIKAPVSKVKVFYKKPNKFRLKKEGGISVLPKGGISINLDNIVSIKDFVALSAGEAMVDGIKTNVVKLLPVNENNNIVLSTLYIDEANMLVRKAVTTTKENGTYEIRMNYSKYSNYGLPDKVIFSFNVKDYKLPKGITMEMGEDAKTSDLDKLKNKKGKLEITYSSYIINKGIDDSVFK